MKLLLLIAIGGAIGSIARYLLSSQTYSILGSYFPYGTLVVNVLGAFLIGIISMIITERFSGYAMELRGLLLIGFLGGFTTFSSFSLETMNLLENGQLSYALLNIVGSVVLCLIATWLGLMLGRAL